MPDFTLKNKVALITGGGRGIGKAIAVAMAEAGADIVVTARSAKELDQAAGEVQAIGRRALPIICDVSKADQVDAMAKRALAEYGKVDILVNNAGQLVFKPLVPLPGFRPPDLPDFATPTSDDEWWGVMQTFLGGTFYTIRALAPQMLERRSGRVINIVSSSVFRSTARFNSVYETAKSGMVGLTRALAAEWGRYQVTCNAIAPGHFPTPMTAEAHEHPKGREWIMSRIPMKRTGDVRDIGAMAVYMASDAGNYITGQTFAIDGGENI
jgi:NAD(P)-dependent dehydrogenase (short-subunit alcohol dehydrogenase family)